jgi:hypothetical protein
LRENSRKRATEDGQQQGHDPKQALPVLSPGLDVRGNTVHRKVLFTANCYLCRVAVRG